jgi:hypothetical protein
MLAPACATYVADPAALDRARLHALSREPWRLPTAHNAESVATDKRLRPSWHRQSVRPGPVLAGTFSPIAETTTEG